MMIMTYVNSWQMNVRPAIRVRQSQRSVQNQELNTKKNSCVLQNQYISEILPFNHLDNTINVFLF